VELKQIILGNLQELFLSVKEEEIWKKGSFIVLEKYKHALNQLFCLPNFLGLHLVENA